jgi:hypothetical protein
VDYSVIHTSAGNGFTRCASVAPACAHAPPHAKSTFLRKDGMAGQLAYREGHENDSSRLGRGIEEALKWASATAKTSS